MDGESVDLRAPRADDEQWVFDACQDAEIQRWTLVPRPYSREHARGFLADSGEWLCRAVIDPAGRPIGMIAVHDLIDGVADIGYWIAPWGRGRGHGSSAVRALVSSLSDDRRVRVVTARIAVANTASRRTIERAGFVEFSRESDACPDGDSRSDAVVYRLLLDQGPPAIRTAR
jgi:RimJ/RimL family protein N-acetyltransferase